MIIFVHNVRSVVPIVTLPAQGLMRPTATGSEITSVKNHGADLNITLTAQQMGMIPETEDGGLDRALQGEAETKSRGLTVMNRHAVLLPAVALINPAGVGVGLLVGHRGPGEAAQIGRDQADVAPSAVVRGHVGDHVGVGAAHQPAVLTVLTVRARDLVGGQELTVHPDISLQISETGKHLGPLWCKEICIDGVHWKNKNMQKGNSEYRTALVFNILILIKDNVL